MSYITEINRYAELEKEVLMLVSISKDSASAKVEAGRKSAQLNKLHTEIVMELFTEYDVDSDDFISYKRVISTCSKWIRKGATLTMAEWDTLELKLDLDTSSTLLIEIDNVDGAEYSIMYSVDGLGFSQGYHNPTGLDAGAEKLTATTENKELIRYIEIKYGISLDFINNGSFHEKFGMLFSKSTL